MKSFGAENAAQQTRKPLFEFLGESPAGFDNLGLRNALNPADDAQKHERPFDESALGAVFPGAMHPNRRIEDLRAQFDAKPFRQNLKRCGRAIKIVFPVVFFDPLPDKFRLFHVRSSFRSGAWGHPFPLYI